MLTPLSPAAYADVLSARINGLPDTEIASQKLTALAFFETGGNPAHLFLLAGCLNDSSAAVRTAAAGIMVRIFNRLSSRRQLNAALKALPFTEEWLDTVQENFSGDTLYSLYAMASFNANGFVRHKAIRLLAATRSPIAIPFLIYRLNDNVACIRDAAAGLIAQYRQPCFYVNFLSHLPLIENILNAKKVYAVQIYFGIVRFLTDRPLTQKVLKMVEHSDKARKSLLVFYINRKGATPFIRKCFLNDRDFQVRKTILLDMGLATGEIRNSIYRKLLADTCADVRYHALMAISVRNPLKYEIANALMDSSRRVRKLAFRLTGFDRQQALDFYNRKRMEGAITPGLIAGLSDHQACEEPLLIQSIASPSSRIAEAGLAALARVDGYRGAWEAKAFLPQVTGGLRRCCIEMVARFYTMNIHDHLAQMYDLGDVRQRKTTVRVFGRMRNWHSFPELIAAVSDPDDTVSLLARSYVKKWIRHPLARKTMPVGFDLYQMSQAIIYMNSPGLSTRAKTRPELETLRQELMLFYKELEKKKPL